jgi:hypothetical protein
MKKLSIIAVSAAAVFGFAIAYKTLKGKPCLKLICKCKKCGDKTEYAITDEEIEDEDEIKVDK